MKFVKRTTNPSNENKNYLRPNQGYNKYRQGNVKSGVNHGKYDVLPNCTSWCYGRYLESQNWTSCKLPIVNAEEWLQKNTTYPEGFTPRVGSVMVYSKGKIGKDEAGHVVFVEDIDKKGNVLVSESGWNAKKRMWTQTIKPTSYKYKSGYKYEGCIYPKENFEIGYYGTLPTENLKYGSKGKQVKYLQDFLNWCMGSYLTIDGHYGPATRDIVKKYQKQYGLEVDGKFGPACRKKAKTIKF